MPDEYDIKTVMVNTGCDRETAIKALEWSWCRVRWAIMRVAHMQLYPESFKEEKK